MLSLSYGWLFVHVPKTGGNSLQSVLAPYSDDRLVAGGIRDGIERFEVTGPTTRHKHFSLKDYSDAMPPDTFARLFKFSVVRNPWERAISWYFSPHRWALEGRHPIWSLEEFHSNLSKMTPAIDMLSLGGSCQVIDMLLRFENLAADAQILFSRLAVSHLTLPHRNRSSRKADWRKYYSMYPELTQLVADLFGADAEAFGYRPPSC
jgi:hypothetical protein